MAMTLRERIGVDLGQSNRIEDGLEAAIAHQIRYLDVKIDVAPNAIESLTPARIAGIRDTCQRHGIHLGVHTSSAVNTAEVAPHVRDGVDRYLLGHLEACRALGGGWMVVHAGFHFSSDIPERMAAGLERLQRLCGHAERLGVNLLLENLNKEPVDAEVRYLAHNVEETKFYFDRLKSPRLRWAFTANHAHLVPEGVEGFLAALDVGRCDEVRLADCWRNGKEEHLRPGEGDFDFPGLFRALEARGFAGHYMAAFGSLQHMIEGRERLARNGA
jgi:sugar phosphate isomerase/epimerase